MRTSKIHLIILPILNDETIFLLLRFYIMKLSTKHIDLATYFNEQISSRASIDAIFSNRISEDCYYSIDFKNINFISRAAAHELITWFNVLSDKGIDLTLMNLSIQVKNMLDIVGESRKSNVKKATFVEHLNFESEKELDDFLKTV